MPLSHSANLFTASAIMLNDGDIDAAAFTIDFMIGARDNTHCTAMTPPPRRRDGLNAVRLHRARAIGVTRKQQREVLTICFLAIRAITRRRIIGQYPETSAQCFLVHVAN